MIVHNFNRPGIPLCSVDLLSIMTSTVVAHFEACLLDAHQTKGNLTDADNLIVALVVGQLSRNQTFLLELVNRSTVSKSASNA